MPRAARLLRTPTRDARARPTSARGVGVALGVLLGTTAVSAAPSSCDPLRERIERHIRDKGIADARVVEVMRGDPPGGRVVGDCDGGRRLLVYRRDADPTASAAPPSAGAAPAAAPRPARPLPVITECADGSSPADGRCPPRR